MEKHTNGVVSGYDDHDHDPQNARIGDDDRLQILAFGLPFLARSSDFSNGGSMITGQRM